jgi:hypothetical protein
MNKKIECDRCHSSHDLVHHQSYKVPTALTQWRLRSSETLLTLKLKDDSWHTEKCKIIKKGNKNSMSIIIHLKAKTKSDVSFQDRIITRDISCVKNKSDVLFSR